MTSTDTVAPIVKSLTLHCTREHAFVVYTERIADWWPVSDYSITGAEATVVVEGRPGGRILEVDPQGAEHVWGEIDVWDPTTTMGHSWYPGTDPAAATRVKVTFESTPTGCVVTVVHGGWPSTPDGERSRGGYDAGWDAVLARYVAAAKA